MGHVAVVIVNLNGGELLERALSALSSQTRAPARVIVVDNASTDGSVDGLEARHAGIEVVRLDENVGFAAANNLAARMADDCEWVALLNPDAFPEPAWLERLLDVAARCPEYAFFGSRLLKAGNPAELDGAGDAYHVSGLAWRLHHGRTAAGRALDDLEVFSPCAAAALYRREVFLAAGGFDEDFFCYFEDNDLSFRLRLAGHRCLYVADAVVHHVGSAIAGPESDFTVYHSFRNLSWTYVKNMPGALLWLYLPQLLLVNLLLLGAFAVRGRRKVILCAQRDAIAGLGGALRKRRAIQRSRTVGSLQIRRVLARGAGGYVTTFLHGLERFFARGVPRSDARRDDRGAVVIRNVASNFGAQAWMLGLTLVTTPYFVHSLGTEGFGIYALVLTLIGYFAFLDLGLGVATVKYVSELAGRGDRDAMGRVLRTSLGAYLLLGGVGAAVIALSASALVDVVLDVPAGFADTARTALVLAGVGFALNMPAAVFGAVPIALQRIALANGLNVLLATVGTAGAVVMLALGHGLTGVLAFSLGLSGVGLVAFVGLARRLLPGISFVPHLDRSALALLARFGSLKFANQMAVQTVYHLDKFLVAALVSVAAVTFYVIPVGIAQRLAALVGNVSVAFLPAASQLHGERDRARFDELYFHAAKLVVLVVLPVASFLVVFAEPILEVWIGAEFAEKSAWPLRLLAAGFAVSALGTIPAVACDAVGRPGVPTTFSVVGAVFNVSLSILLIPPFGIEGAAAVNLIHALVGMPFFLVYVHRRVLDVSLREFLRRTLGRPLVAITLTWVPMALLVPFAGSVPGLALAFAATLVAFVVLGVLVGASETVDRRRAFDALRRRRGAAVPEAVS